MYTVQCDDCGTGTKYDKKKTLFEKTEKTIHNLNFQTILARQTEFVNPNDEKMKAVSWKDKKQVKNKKLKKTIDKMLKILYAKLQELCRTTKQKQKMLLIFWITMKPIP